MCHETLSLFYIALRLYAVKHVAYTRGMVATLQIEGCKFEFRSDPNLFFLFVTMKF